MRAFPCFCFPRQCSSLLPRLLAPLAREQHSHYQHLPPPSPLLRGSRPRCLSPGRPHVRERSPCCYPHAVSSHVVAPFRLMVSDCSTAVVVISRDEDRPTRPGQLPVLWWLLHLLLIFVCFSARAALTIDPADRLTPAHIAYTLPAFRIGPNSATTVHAVTCCIISCAAALCNYSTNEIIFHP